MIRNAAAVLSSRDLFNWKVEKIFLYSADVDHDGFGYWNFDFDGTNMIAAARTAFKVSDGTDPRRGHDSNLLTFHRLDDFRNLSPDHGLTISGNQVLRYERTQYQNAPLGSFTLGSTFNGSALTAPNGIGQAANRDIYIRETGGRILHFDATGNFLETNSSAPVSFSTSSLSHINQPSDGTCSWSSSGAGNWFDPLNWYYWGRPDTDEEIATFGSAATAAATITILSATQTWNFNTDGNTEGWITANASNTVVSGGYLQGSANTNTASVQISRTDRFFYGSAVPEVRIRMKADSNCNVYFWWGTTLADTFAAARRLTGSYTNNGADQELVFPMAGNANWDGKAITRLRFDPLVQTNSTGGFAIDSITVPKESYRIKGLRFRNVYPYTLSGGGQLRIESGNGTGTIEVLQGRHTNNVELILGSGTDMVLTNNTSLHLKLGIDLNGKTLRVTGPGKLLMQNALVMNGGTLSISGETPLTFTNNSTGASLDGTLQFLPEGTFAPSADDSFALLDNPGVLGTKRFTAVTLPTLSAGLEWNTNSLYSAGSVSVEAVQHSLSVTTPRGNSNPAAGVHNYDYGTNLTVVLTNSPVANGPTTQYVCRGWTGTGSVPAGGSSTNTGSFTLTTNSAIIWLWSTNYWLDTTSGTGGSVDVSDGWKTNGASVQITAAANAYYHFTGWTGDVTTNSSQITLVMSRARSVTAGFAQNITANTSTPEWWLAQYGLTNFNADAIADADGDGLLAWQEYVAGTDPTNPASCFQITGGSVTPQGAVIRWSSVSNRSYSLSKTTSLLESFAVLPGASNLPATPPENAYTNPSPDGGAAFYRISVQP